MKVVVTGGGLAGLACTTELVAHGADVVLLETADRLGGQIRTTRDAGFLIEDGAATLDPSGDLCPEWAHDLGLGRDLVERRDLPMLVLLNGALDRVQSGDTAALFGLPAGSSAGEAAPVSLRDGMDSLVGAVVRSLAGKADLRSGNGAVALQRDGNAWTVSPEIGPALTADAIALTIPPRPAAWLVHPVDAAAARALSHLSARATVVVTLGFARSAVAHPLDAAGFTVPLEAAEPGLHSCAFSSSQFDNRAPADAVLLRAVIRPGRGELVGVTDADWANRAVELLAPLLGIRDDPLGAWVSRWPEAMPDYGPRYAADVAATRETLQSVGQIELAGAAYDGWGVDGAISSGRAAARRLLKRH